MAEENKNLNEELKSESTENPATENSDGMAENENGTDVQVESQNTAGAQPTENESAVSAEPAESENAVSTEPAESETSEGNAQNAPVGETNVKSSRRQTILLIGIALIIIGIIFIVIALTQPRTVTTTEVTYSSASSTATDSDSSSDGDSSSSDSDSSSGSSSSSSSTTTASSSETTTDENYVINLNTCTADDLTVLDGIGDAKASAIIAYRETLGGYTSVEQIKNISGIGDTTYENIKDHLTV